MKAPELLAMHVVEAVGDERECVFCGTEYAYRPLRGGSNESREVRRACCSLECYRAEVRRRRDEDEARI